ncbi:GH25 family lysozyme [Labedaea rhizosphaerae]|uniref:lysozyme n=1 Tax=Labedaea rhizosphaerae TaxID=598644 RepID=A0A4R6SHT9_LABRH|nr:GH25 family lysozyme [Labedaea rhizosphaerae]TDQ01374.1 GH25 family lysozyme M1 (1,4-beta-N-acetylmuramidase) [Labedaea rhizosphaerae]
MKLSVPVRRRLLGAVTAAVALGATLVCTATAGASSSNAPSVEPDHAMGWSIRAHEGVAGKPAPSLLATQTPGLDVSHYQGSINWATVKANGAKFAWIKATEGTSYHDPYFSQNYLAAYNQGIIRGAYHYGRPDVSSGTVQADYFASNGGGWSRDGLTLPGTLDIEWGTAGEGGDCYGKSHSQIVQFILSFSNEYHARTGRWPVIYTATSWWTECTGNTGDFSSTNPLWVARYSTSVGTLPYNWGYQTVWQYADSGIFPGDQDRFNGDYSRVQALANG